MDNGNEAAYPHTQHCSQRGSDWQETVPGMTKREAFAMAAMQGLCAAMSDYDAREMVCNNADANGHHPKAQIAMASVAYADALLAELAKEATP